MLEFGSNFNFSDVIMTQLQIQTMDQRKTNKELLSISLFGVLHQDTKQQRSIRFRGKHKKLWFWVS